MIKYGKNILNLSIMVSLVIISLASAKPFENTKTKVLDKTFNTAGVMFAYTEFELSGEPLAESLGLDLDTLDPNAINEPTEFDYTTGIESYEYSEEAMYALNYQSKMGPHLVNGLLNKQRGGDMPSLAKRFIRLAKVTGNTPETIPLNIYPIALPYISGSPKFAQKIDTTIVNHDEVIIFKHDKEKKIKTVIPAYLIDYKSLAWRESGMDKTFNPAAFGGALLKDIMWAQDFLGGMHEISSDEEVDAINSAMDHDDKYALGVSASDGLNGVILTELSHERILYMQEKLGFDGQTLGVDIAPNYDAKKDPIWFANKIAVTQGIKNSVKSVDALKVVESFSTLRDTWQLLWPMSELYAFSDQRTNNTNQSLAFLSVFDGDPFKKAPLKNSDTNIKNDIKSDDAFSVASNLANMLFQNLTILHFNKKAGTLVDRFDGKQGEKVTTFDVAYSMEALRIFQRAIDALPVGYGSGDGAKSLKTTKGKKAINIIELQAEFLMAKLKSTNGLYYDGYILNNGVVKIKSIGTQFAVVRGLTSAYLATNNNKYRKAARDLMIAIEKNMYDKDIGTFVDSSKEFTPYSIGAVSGGLRDAIQHLKNIGSERESSLELKNLIDRFTIWFQLVINGNSTTQGAQLSEWLYDTGEFVEAANKRNNNGDKDNVFSITENNTAMTMAAKVKLSK